MKIKTSSVERLNRRYLSLKVEDRKDVEQAIVKFAGALGLAQTALVFVEDRKDSGKMMIAINRDSLDLVRAAFELSEKKIEILRVSGTIKGLNR